MSEIPRRVLEKLNVSRETSDRLEILSALLIKWNPKINLVSKSTIENLWTRHIADSAQLFTLRSETVGHWVDIGSGAGFPGLVVAILAAEKGNIGNLTMIESDQRKCAFLRTVLRETGVHATVIAERIEKVDCQNADVLSARALADLSTLFEFSEKHLRKTGIALFPKGISWENEVITAKKSWSFEFEAISSETEHKAVVLKVGDIQRV